MKIRILVLLRCLFLAAPFAAAQTPERPSLVVVLIIDGLRPDSVTPEFNAASFSIGTLPSRHGIVSNALYLPTVSSATPCGQTYQATRE